MSAWSAALGPAWRVAPPWAHHHERAGDEGLFAAQAENVPGASLRVVLWAILLAISLAVLLVPNLPVATPSPMLAVAVATMVGAVGLALVHLSTLRYVIFGRPLDLFIGA